jgi:hypothetical protein
MEYFIGRLAVQYFIYSGIIINILLVVRGLVTLVSQIFKGGK